MSIKDEIEQEIWKYLDKEDNLSREDRKAYLTAIFDKHFTIDSLPFKVQYLDIQMMIDMAKKDMLSVRLPVVISEKTLEPYQAPHISLLESFIGFLTKNGLLRKTVAINYSNHRYGRKENG